MFPQLQVSLFGLDPNQKYSVMIDFACVDQKRYRYSFHQSKWIVTGSGVNLNYLNKFKIVEFKL